MVKPVRAFLHATDFMMVNLSPPPFIKNLYPTQYICMCDEATKKVITVKYNISEHDSEWS